MLNSKSYTYPEKQENRQLQKRQILYSLIKKSIQEVIGIKAQYSMEFILIFAFSLIIIIPLVNIMQERYSESREDLSQSQAKHVLEEISIAAQNTFYAGYPSRTTLSLVFPKGIKNVTSRTSADEMHSELIFTLRRGSGEVTIVQSFPFILNTSVTPTDGKRKILIKAEENGNTTIVDS